MKKIKYLAMILIFLFALIYGENLTLDECFQLAEKNHPLMKQKNPINEIAKNQLKNINTKWYPKLDLKLSATYQSDVTKIDMDLPVAMASSITIPEADKNQYKSEIEINQLFYDGGLISIQKELMKQDNKLSLQQLETNFQKIKSSIANVYYNLIIIEKQKEILGSWLLDLQNNHKVLKKLIQNGIKEKSDIYEIEIKIHEIEQKIVENKEFEKYSRDVLSELIGTEVKSDTEIYNPKISNYADSFSTSQSKLFDYQIERMNIAKKIAFRNRLPKVFGFGKIGYGKPGLNMMSNKFDQYYFIGVGLNWNLWDWNTNKRDNEKIKYNQKIIEFSREIYDKNTRIELNKMKSSVNNLKQKIEKDKEIFILHTKLKNSAKNKFENGVINTTEFLKYNNDFVRAELNMEIHKIQMYKEKVNYLIIKGEL